MRHNTAWGRAGPTLHDRRGPCPCHSQSLAYNLKQFDILHSSPYQLFSNHTTIMSDLDPLLSPPFATVAGIANFRDIASPRTRDNRLITPRLAWRCADPSRVQPEGLMTMSQELGKVNHPSYPPPDLL